MTLRELEKRLAAVESDLATVKARLGGRAKNPRWYRDHAGAFADDPALAEAARFGEQYRAQVNGLAPRRKRATKAKVG